MCFPVHQVLGELPEHCVFTLVYGLPIYWLAGLNEAPDRFLLNFVLVWLMVYCSRAMALFVAAALPTLQTSAFMGNSLFTVFYLTGGFVISLENMWLGEDCVLSMNLLFNQPWRPEGSSLCRDREQMEERKDAVFTSVCVCLLHSGLVAVTHLLHALGFRGYAAGAVQRKQIPHQHRKLHHQHWRHSCELKALVWY